MLLTPDRTANQSTAARTYTTLPEPPTDAEKASYGDRGILLIVASSLISFSAMLISQVRFAALTPVIAAIFSPFVVFTMLSYVLSLCVNLGTRGFDPAAHHALVRSWRPGSYPSLDVFLPVCGEPAAILSNTWLHVTRLVTQYPGPVSVYVLDDAASGEVEEMAGDFGFSYLVRPNRGWMKKAGNLRHGFARSSGEFILLLDADFAPRPDLPIELLPYFFADRSLGIVQTPQFFRTEPTMSWMERGAGAVQEFFYRLLQVSLDNYGNAVCVGTCAIYRRAALEVNGGTTPIHHSEDIHTGFDLFRAGWGTRYVPVPLSAGLCPSSPHSFLAQQYRWCSGSLSLLGTRKFWATRMRWQARCGYLAGFFYYMYTALFVFVGPAICLLLLAVLPGRVNLANYALILPSIIYEILVFPAWHRCRFGPEAFMAKMLYGWAHLFSLWDTCRRTEMTWQATGDSGIKSGIRRMWWGIAAWTGGTSVIWAGLAGWRVCQRGGEFIPLLTLGLANCVITGMALGAHRDHLRKSSRDLESAAIAAELHEVLRTVRRRKPQALALAEIKPRQNEERLPDHCATMPVPAVPAQARASPDDGAEQPALADPSPAALTEPFPAALTEPFPAMLAELSPAALGEASPAEPAKAPPADLVEASPAALAEVASAGAPPLAP